MKKNFRKFIDKIRLKPSQRRDAKTKAENVCKRLYSFYYDGKYDPSVSLYVGSYGKNTNIRPVNDVDIVFEIPEELFEKYDKQKNGQSQLLQDVKKKLAEKYMTSEGLKAKGTVVKISTSEWSHNVELIPAFKQENGDYLIPNTKDGGFWDSADYRAEIKSINESNTNDGRTKNIIKMLKKWNIHRNVGLKSFHLELLTVDFLATWDAPDAYAELFVEFFKYMKKQSNRVFYMPGTNEPINIGNEWVSKVRMDLARVIAAVEFEEKLKYKSAYEKWSKVFGKDFPKLDVKNESLSLEERILIEKLTNEFPSAEEEFIENICDLGLSEDKHLVIEADVNMNGFRRGKYREFIRKGLMKIRKSKKIIFTVKSCNVEEPYNLKWKVRNFGFEAKNIGQLRGKIFDDTGEGKCKEDTMYTGDHYVEAYIIKDGKCVARDILFVPIE